MISESILLGNYHLDSVQIVMHVSWNPADLGCPVFDINSRTVNKKKSKDAFSYNIKNIHHCVSLKKWREAVDLYAFNGLVAMDDLKYFG